MDSWQTKAWGRTRLILASDLYSRHELEVLEGGYSSVHYHDHRANRFVVSSGRIVVVRFFAWRVDRIVLTRDNVLDVPSLVVHQFQCLAPSLLYEEYWPDRGGEISESDIVRLSIGGLCDVASLTDLPYALMREHCSCRI